MREIKMKREEEDLRPFYNEFRYPTYVIPSEHKLYLQNHKQE